MDQTVGIVLVSHSARLAAGLRELLAQMGADRVPVAAAGGTADGGVGTSYDLILAAIGEAERGAGVVVLPDLGSAVLTAMTVLEDHPRGDVRLVDAPFVEGAVAAALTAAAGGDLAAVAAAARGARAVAKFDDPPAAGGGETEADAGDAQEDTAAEAAAAVTLPADLHARPAGRLAREAARFASGIRLEHAGKSVNPVGVLAVMSLGAKLGSTITVRASGPDAAEAVAVLSAILAEAE